MSNKGITAPDANLGRRLIDQYVLVDKIGEGGMGAVYLADQPTVGRRAVVKLLHPTLSRDPQVAARFNLEARAAAALNHPHIVTVYNYGALPDGVLYLAMEHLDGRDLERAIEESGRLSPVRAVHVARQICEALAEAHARGVVHRDLKPSNVMLVTRGRDDEFVKVLDFGIAKVRGVALTSSGMVFGTAEYMSPEQLRGRALDGRSDLYALGVVLFEMLTGRLPFACETPEAFMAAHLETLPPAVGEVAPDVELPPGLEALTARLLAKDPAARPATAEELVGAARGGARRRASDGGRRQEVRSAGTRTPPVCWPRGAAARGAGRRHHRHAGARRDPGRAGAGTADHRRPAGAAIADAAGAAIADAAGAAIADAAGAAIADAARAAAGDCCPAERSFNADRDADRHRRSAQPRRARAPVPEHEIAAVVARSARGAPRRLRAPRRRRR